MSEIEKAIASCIVPIKDDAFSRLDKKICGCIISAYRVGENIRIDIKVNDYEACKNDLERTPEEQDIS